MIGTIKRWLGGTVSFYWAFAALNFTVLLAGAGLLWGTGRIDKDKLEAISAIVQAPPKPDAAEAPKEPPPEPEYTALASDAERSRWLGEALRGLHEQRERTARERAQYESFLKEERRVLEAERDKVEARQKALALREKAFTENKQAWAKAQQDAGFAELVKKLTAMDDAGKVAQILLAYPTEKIALYLATFKSSYAAEVIAAVQDELEGQGKQKLMKEILDALEQRKPPGAGNENPNR